MSPSPRPRPSTPSRSPGRWLWPAVLGVVVLVGVVAVVLSSGGDDGSDDGGSVEIASTVRVRGSALPALTDSANDPAVGRTAPRLTGVGFDGETVEVGNEGTAHVVVFLAHWCPHCQAEVPRIVALAEAGDIDVPVTAVATGTNAAQQNYPPSAWLEREDWPFPVLVDTDGNDAADAYGVSGYPFMVFVDAQGRVVRRYSGEISESDLRQLFSALAAGRTLPALTGSSSTR